MCRPLETHAKGVWAYPYAAEAAEFGAVGTETGVSQLLHADEAAEHLRDTLKTQLEKRRSVGAFTQYISSHENLHFPF